MLRAETAPTNASSAATYGERMTDALRRVKTEYTLLMLDDFFLREPVKMDRLHDLVRWMDAQRDGSNAVS